MAKTDFNLVIKPRRGWQPLDVRELWSFRGLLGFLVWRDIKLRYKQTALGAVWAILQPLIGMLVFGVLLARVARFGSGGPNYSLFVLAGLIPWTFFANAVSMAGNSLIGSEQMIRKIYFPRLFVPLAAILALGLDAVVSLVLLGVLMAAMKVAVSPCIVLLPLFLLATVLAAAGIGFFLAALNVKYRDIKYVVPFFTQVAMFVTPVLYPLNSMSAKMRAVLSLNPMAGVVEGFRFAVLGNPASLHVLWVSSGVSVALLVLGVFFFKRMELTFADVI